jgi:ribose transport system substrate-binding protein
MIATQAQRARASRTRLASPRTLRVLVLVVVSVLVSSGAAYGATQNASGLAAARAALAASQKPSAGFTAPGPSINVKSLHGKTIWFIPISSEIPAVPPQAAGVQEAAAAAGMKYHTCDGNFIAATESACITQAINSKAAGIVTNDIAPSTVATATQDAASAHIPIVVMGQNGTNTKWLQYAASDIPAELVAAAWIAANSNGHANVLAAYISGDSTTLAGTKAFANQLHKYCSACGYFTVSEPPSATTDWTSAVSSALLQHPSVTYVFSQYDNMLQYVQSGVQESGHKVDLLSTAASLAALQEVRAGGPDLADDAINSNYYGWATTDQLFRMMLHKASPTYTGVPVRMFDSTNIRSLKLTQAAALTGIWWGPLTYERDFEKLWNVG